MQQRLIVGMMLFLLGVGVGMVIQPCLRLAAERRATLREMAACEQELQAMIPKLRAYAQLHHGHFPANDAALAKVIGKTLPTEFLYNPEFSLVPQGSGSRTIIFDRDRHFSRPNLFEERVVPRNRIHMLLDDLTIHSVQDWKAYD